jgi:hypothetical protein
VAEDSRETTRRLLQAAQVRAAQMLRDGKPLGARDTRALAELEERLARLDARDAVVESPEPAPMGKAGITDPRARKMWEQAERELRKLGRWRPVHAPLLERLVLNRVAAADALATAMAKPEVPGSTGQMVAHPMFAVAARCDQVALACTRELCLSPGTALAIAAVAGEPVGSETDSGQAAADALDELAARRRRPG